MDIKAILGISGLALTEQEVRFFEQYQPHGVILFKRNCESTDQIKFLVSHIKEITNNHTKIFIDQEGGRVQRIKPPIGKKHYPNMEFFGAKCSSQPLENVANEVEENFFELMSELKELGIDVTCAPVCDLRDPKGHDVIGDRSFGSDIEIVTKLSLAALKGIQRAGGEGVIKHIPGHGKSTEDSHHNLPIVTNPLSELEKSDFQIFKNLANSCPYAMTAHIIYNSLDPSETVTNSKTAIDYIKNQIGFKGLIMTDDIDMKALSGTIEEKVEKAINAGCNLILQCNGDIQSMIEVAETLTA